MKVKWLGHSSMLVTSDEGLRVITDPFTPGGMGLDYAPIREEADVVTVSHDHADHNNVASVRGNPKVVKGGTQTVRGVAFRGIESYHDESSGRERGRNTIYCFTIDGINVCHLGDLGQNVSPELQAKIGPVDVLFIPVGGNFTIDHNVAADVCRRLKPRVVLPMHYRNERCPRFPVNGIEGFLALMKAVRQANASEVEFEKKSLPEAVEVFVLKPAL